VRTPTVRQIVRNDLNRDSAACGLLHGCN
jgi:hypothetical protein